MRVNLCEVVTSIAYSKQETSFTIHKMSLYNQMLIHYIKSILNSALLLHTDQRMCKMVFIHSFYLVTVRTSTKC